MKINQNIFRAYDIRGIYPDELNEKTAERVAISFANLYPKAKKIVIAKDPRRSSPALSKAIIKALTDSGKDVIDLGIAPDPLFYFSIFHYKFDGGIMISGSHNPKNYNGLTLHIRQTGKKISKDIIRGDLEKIKDGVLKYQKRPYGEKPQALVKIKSAKKGKVIFLDLAKDYIDFVARKVKLKRPLKIIIDSGNGACGFLPEKIFKKLGCKVETLYGEFDGNFPHHLPDPYKKENLKDIKREVLKKKADLGFAYDSDGDRVAPIDNKGRVVSGDFCLMILALEVLKKHKGPIVHCMRVSKAFLDEIKKRGVRTFFSISHHNAIINKIIEKKAVFGGEITYHFLFPKDYYRLIIFLFINILFLKVLIKLKILKLVLE